MVSLQDYPEQDRSYLQAHTAADTMLRRREIKAFCTGHNPETGRTIHIETDPGWDPDPMYQEFNELGYARPSN